MDEIAKKNICCICHGPLSKGHEGMVDKNGNNVYFGNSVWPLPYNEETDRCCDDCNNRIVVAVRVMQMQNEKEDR